jgi:hypothetical protein
MNLLIDSLLLSDAMHAPADRASRRQIAAVPIRDQLLAIFAPRRGR